MKKIKLFTLIAATSWMLLACNKDKENRKIEYPLKAALDAKVGVDSLNIPALGVLEPSKETGVKISFLRDGVVNQLGGFLPVVGKFKVTLWDFDTKQRLASDTINITTNTKTFVYIDIPSTPVVANKKYVISINNRNLNTVSPNGVKTCFAQKKNGDDIFDFTSGNVKFEQKLTTANANIPIFPATAGSAKNIEGLPDFTFVAN